MPKRSGRLLSLYMLVPFALAPTHARSSSETVIYSFKNFSDGADPQAGLTNIGGTLYGTTESGGTGRDCYPSGPCGTAFSLTPNGTETVLYSFGQSNADAAYPHAGSMITVNGTLFGTAQGGLLYPAHSGDGTIFNLTPGGAETVLYSFDGSAFGPNGLVSAGNRLYGTTVGGGSKGGGTIFTVTSAGVFTVLHSFAGTYAGDGWIPYSGLVRVGGLFYGTTFLGSSQANDSSCQGNGCGTLYSVTTAGVVTILYTFGQGAGDGALPRGDLIYSHGKLYGTTTEGGGTGCGGVGCGTVFSFTPGGTESVLHAFQGIKDGAMPLGGLVEVAGKLYGTTPSGGAHGYGTVFRITTAGVEKVLHSFGARKDGASPNAGLANIGGTLYGTTAGGGEFTYGTVFQITP